MSEYANQKTRGGFIAAVFAMQGIGILVAGAVAMAVSKAFNAAYPAPSFAQNHVLSTQPQGDFVWRIVLMFGAVPAAMTYYWRMKMPETYKFFSAQFFRRHGLHLIGTSTTWFLLDIAFYSNNLTQKDIYPSTGLLPKSTELNAIEEVYFLSRAMFLVALFATVPGYWFTVFLIDKIGRFIIQLVGFLLMSIFMAIVGIYYEELRGKECKTCETGFKDGKPMLFAVLYGLTFFFANFGPNSTTFIVPAELFPARFRSTCHGISAASGKAGAIIGAFWVQSYTLDNNVVKIKKAIIGLAVVNFVGFLFTFMVPETNGRSLEEISGDDEILGEKRERTQELV